MRDDPQVYLEEFKYLGKKVIRHMDDNLSYFSSVNDFGDFNDEYFLL